MAHGYTPRPRVHAHDPLSPFTKDDKQAKFMAKVATDHLRLWDTLPAELLVSTLQRWAEDEVEGAYPISGDVLARLDPTRPRRD